MIVDDGLAGGKEERVVCQGIRRFFRFFLMTLGGSSLPFTFVFLLARLFLQLLLQRRSTNPDLAIAAIFIDLVTLGAFFMCLSFFKIYVYMWYIAASKIEKKPFTAGKAVGGRHFWRTALELLGFDAVFAAVIYLVYLNENQVLRYILGWAFTTAFFTALAVYLVRLYRTVSKSEGD